MLPAIDAFGVGQISDAIGSKGIEMRGTDRCRSGPASDAHRNAWPAWSDRRRCIPVKISIDVATIQDD